jgi:glutamate/tyrosine decarboxylase-like PLP-dependent enzyme
MERNLTTRALLAAAADHAADYLERLDPAPVAATASAQELRARLGNPGQPTIVCAQAGEINTGAFDDFEAICSLAHAHDAWVHVDGAFGLWAATSSRFAHLTRGTANADS